MKKSFFAKSVLATLLLSSLFGCASQSETADHWQAGKTYYFSVLHTNDHHGRFWQNSNGEYGMAARKTLLDQMRADIKAKGGTSLLLSGGDINTGVPESDLQHAEPDFKGMNLLGYDAMALGNHEFDNPLEVLRMQEQWAKFPLLSANIYDKKTGKRLFKPYQIFNKQGLKIAVIGLTTEDTARIGNPEYISGVEFRDPKVEAKKVIAELRATEKPDIIIASTHMGHYEDGKHGINAPGDVALARSLPEGYLDLIVGGHSQDPVCMEAPNVTDKNFKPGDKCIPDQQNGTWIVQAHEWGKYVGRADFEFKDGQLRLVNYELVPVNLKKKVTLPDGSKKQVFIQNEIKQDPKVLKFLTPYQEKGQDKLNLKIAVSNGKLEGDRHVVRFQQTNLGRLIAASQMERANADFGIMNSGGVRDSIPAGNITYKDVLKVQPFGNIVAYMEMKGKDLKKYLDIVANKPVDSGAYPQFYNISMTVKNGKVYNVKIAGKPLQANKTYRFSIPSYNAAGGDGYPKITDKAGYVNTGFVDAEVLKEYLQKNSPIDVNKFAPKGEIVYKK
ncbi:bifunctional UDP-sugar hydrolase/5'-nucleotidase [Mergibacter septicus]|uniref:Bifunctional UDP-sugar hydrolase/5'-nucleotidase n=1 Tax=Mergibacter septicus TaxID=221402 RepID=A0A8E3MGJ4_9PAST|nr:bifunctional UDP-sugar hydrolase/5'-nucleotidase UshA [Mergibacter septicus]AWX15774.1 bifunctional UDP-sugar hydrolase/5'-nucleotidase [Mergibacter septicus]QDJ15027.1 bifunctional UDP-sugar hydrolase/5'-nucleotidase [Mergibacter septicus]UTU47548.1 bifunctional UDP-sugar hydrolase/5'-nucleotidase [Mergibacter septicus]WMR95270.1 bifunctional UDP-sugar hydrolase/5'-nucleotidase UshA [Mergibacter septicus]